jgi:hypothetical protein
VAVFTGYNKETLFRLNPILNFRDAVSCDILLTPLRHTRIEPEYSKNAQLLYYRVRHGETLFGIARRILQVHENNILALNALETTDLKPGQILKIGWLARHDVLETLSYVPPVPIISIDGGGINPPTSAHLQKQTGVAWWNKAKPDPHLFALHRLAPLNSMIEIHNPMFGRKVYAKVIGTIPPTYSEDITVIVSQGVAKSLGALDGRFYVEMSYEAR